MRTMPSHLKDGATVPTMPDAEIVLHLSRIADRHLTDDEMKNIDKMLRHNWTLRIIASDLFGDRITDTYFENPNWRS